MAEPGDSLELRGPAPGAGPVLASAARALATTAVVLVLYATLPFDRELSASVGAVLVGGIVVLVVVIAAQLRAILQAAHPALRAVEALAASTPLFLAVFAFTYVLIGRNDPAGFTQPMSRLDAFYFATTVFATVGFGDIAAASSTARTVVTVQMLADLVVLGLGLRVIMGAVKLGRERRSAGVPPGRPRRGEAVTRRSAAEGEEHHLGGVGDQ